MKFLIVLLLISGFSNSALAIDQSPAAIKADEVSLHRGPGSVFSIRNPSTENGSTAPQHRISPATTTKESSIGITNGGGSERFGLDDSAGDLVGLAYGAFLTTPTRFFLNTGFQVDTSGNPFQGNSGLGKYSAEPQSSSFVAVAPNSATTQTVAGPNGMANCLIQDGFTGKVAQFYVLPGNTVTISNLVGTEFVTSVTTLTSGLTYVSSTGVLTIHAGSSLNAATQYSNVCVSL